jgi:hypothetical protein
MTTADAMPDIATIPFIWRLRLTLHGVRLSRLAPDSVATISGHLQVPYRATMVDGHLTGVESAPLDVRINIRAASFVLRAFGQESAEIHADRSGALFSALGYAGGIGTTSPPGSSTPRLPRGPASWRPC